MITITDTDLEKTLKSLLQRRVTFIIHKKQWRNGRVLLFKQNGFFIELTVKNDKEKIERFEIPIPFDIIEKGNRIKFSYELNSLVCNQPDIVNELKKIEPNCRNKYFNDYLEIHIL
ncbi:MAG: hypothetical protein PHS54_00215 [Clostridia bacterium]|nr:hypothetical protein [Clostridia bacterium]